MDITTLILLTVSVVNLIILFIVFSKTNQKNNDLPELKNHIATLQDQTTQTFANMNERMIRIETNVDRVTKDIGTNFRENRKEISDNFGLVQKTLDTRVRELQDHNTKKLEEMRQTVDEKLQASVEKRFNESFKTISTQLTQVYQGLGEMKTLANGVGDLKKVMEGVKTRGIYGEVQLGNIISDTLSSEQYRENIATKKGSNDRVEFAVKMPGKDETAQVFLPIDSKFPVENYQRLVAAYEQGNKTEILKYQKALAIDVKEQAKKISTKYIDPPHTTEFAMMFLPTESLYAEILRIPGLDDEIRQKFHITIASPSTLPVILSGLLMGFRTLAIEKRSSEVWQILGAVKSQFGKFGDLLEATKKKLQESANKIDAAATTSRAIERKLKNVESLPSSESLKLLDGLDDQDFNSEENS
ncbi:DNA recombination protein RmuC [Candidatus Saccharibacteria bacterium]|nr:DNA recombination protein RmuC [Candidatus Saccharibacteria bacterium]